jgi:hypothetical protein
MKNSKNNILRANLALNVDILHKEYAQRIFRRRSANGEPRGSGVGQRGIGSRRGRCPVSIPSGHPPDPSFLSILRSKIIRISKSFVMKLNTDPKNHDVSRSPSVSLGPPRSPSQWALPSVQIGSMGGGGGG